MTLFVLNDVAMVAGQKEGLGTPNYNRWLNTKYLMDLAPAYPGMDLWMYGPPFSYSPTAWTCAFQLWVTGSDKSRFHRYCQESHATVPLVIVLAFLVALMLGLHIWAWISTKNNSPLFTSAEEISRPRRSDHPPESE